MATRFCMSCGGEFIASVERCPDCDVELVDERPDGHLAPDQAAEGQVGYELHEWAVESRVMVQQLLTAEGVPHAWQGTELLVPAAFEALVDTVLEQVEVTTLPTLDPELPKLAYDVEDWSDEQQTDLMAALEAAAVPYEFDEDGALVVHEEDEARVEVILDGIEFPDALDADAEWDGGDGPGDAGDDDDGDGDAVGSDGDVPEGAELLSDLFVAADRLSHKATDAEGVLALVDAAELAPRVALPYGFTRPVWQGLVAQAVALRGLLESSDASDDDIEEAARDLRDTLRPLV